MKILTFSYAIVTFLKEPENSPNREARMEPMQTKANCFHVANLNMPYLGTITEVWTKEQLNKKIKDKEIKVRYFGRQKR